VYAYSSGSVQVIIRPRTLSIELWMSTAVTQPTSGWIGV